MTRVVIGLSGGVDSSVAAWKLQQQGYDVVGLFMVNWHDTTGLLEGDCPAEHDRLLAELVARKLKIPFHEVDFSEQYRNRVVDYMFSEYEKGRTPNPDVLCNREIKFDLFLKKAEELGADYIATGHYCRHETIEKEGKTYHRLLAGLDKNKDQSYFLCQLSQNQLEKTLFPIGDIIKPEVRKIASELNLATADRKDSQGICFVGKVDLPVFLQQKLQSKTGDIIEIPVNHIYPHYNFVENQNNLDETFLKNISTAYHHLHEMGKVVGKHGGAHFYTIGQRKGLNVGGHVDPLFVIETDIENNIIYVGMGHQHGGLNQKGLFIQKEEIHWIRPDLEMKDGDTWKLKVRIRYRQPLEDALLIQKESGMYIIFDKLQRGVASGQFAAWYDGEELIGSGVIA